MPSLAGPEVEQEIAWLAQDLCSLTLRQQDIKRQESQVMLSGMEERKINGEHLLIILTFMFLGSFRSRYR